MYTYIRKFILSVLMFLPVFCLQNCGTDNDPKPEETPLVITSITPDQGMAGISVTITGTGFETTPPATSVTLNGQPCTITSLSSTQIIITIPSGSGAGKITVTRNGTVAEGPLFTYGEPPVSTSSCAADASFGTEGQVSTDVAGGETGSARSVNDNLVQPDGKIILIGESIQTDGHRPVVIMRYTPAGALDGSWGTNGQTTTTLPTSYEYLKPISMALQADNKLVVVGEAKRSGQPTEMMILRYLSNGTLDASFDKDGILLYTPDVPDYNGSTAWGVTAQPDGKIVFCGYSTQFDNTSAVVVRLLADGSPDPGFGTKGSQTLSFSAEKGQYILTDVALQTDGKLIVSGYAENSTASAFAIARLLSNGNPDASFGTGGKQTSKIFSNVNRSYRSIIQPDGKILLAGYAQSSTSSVGIVVRYTADGILDNAFGSAASKGYLADGLLNNIRDIALMPDGRILTCAGWYVTRYRADGTVDNTFCDGKYYLKVSNTNTYFDVLSLQPDQAVVCSGLFLKKDGDQTSQLYTTVRYMNGKSN